MGFQEQPEELNFSRTLQDVWEGKGILSWGNSLTKGVEAREPMAGAGAPSKFCINVSPSLLLYPGRRFCRKDLYFNLNCE